VRKAYSLVELLLVVAIVAAIGSGVSVSYGKMLVDRSHNQLTQREMAEIKRAFLSFYADNSPRLLAGVTLPGSTVRLPTADFCSTFTSANAPLPATAAHPNRLYGILEFFERYGLWCLMRPGIIWKDHADDSDFIVFDSPTVERPAGWTGPYLTAPVTLPCIESRQGLLVAATRENCSATDPFFPQIRTRFSDPHAFYRVVYFEHSWNEGDPAEPVYRRLLLVASSRPNAFETRESLLALTGNRRGGDASGYPLDRTTGTIPLADEARGLYFTELLNLDQMP